MARITNTHIVNFDHDGFVFFDQLLDRQQAKAARLCFDRIFSGEFETGILPDKVKWRKGRDPEGVPRSVCNGWKSDRTIAGIVLLEEIGKIAARLMTWLLK